MEREREREREREKERERERGDGRQTTMIMFYLATRTCICKHNTIYRNRVYLST